MKPKVSIVLPTYNRGNIFLIKAINSVLNQSFKDFELIIIDDASTDETKKIISKFNDKRIHYIKNEKNHGEYWSTNYGISLAQGSYLTWVHSDDVMPPDSLLLRIKALEKNKKLDFVHGDIIKIDENDNVIKKSISTDKVGEHVFKSYINSLKEGNMVSLVHHTTIMMKKNFFYKAGPFDCSLPFAGDIDWLIRALRVGCYSRIPDILYFYRSHPQTRRVMDLKKGIDKIAIHKLIASRYV